MFKRMWKANQVFTFLFLLSFSLTFSIVYYGMFLKSQLRIVNQTAERINYAYRGYYSCMWDGDTSDRIGVELPELGQGILSYVVNVCGEDAVGVRSAYVVMDMKENLMEPLERGEYFQTEREYDKPQCIVGDAWLQDVEQKETREVICISGYDCEVTGVLKPNGFVGFDQRIFLYGPSMSREFLEDLICMNESMSVDYRIPEDVDSGQIVKYEKWLQSGIFEGTEEIPGMDEVDGGVSAAFQEIVPMYNKFFVFMMSFCFVNCVFLTYVWCAKKVKENMLKRVFGFSTAGIWLDGFKEIAIYEVISVLISSVICMVIETFRGNTLNFFVTWKYGVGIMVTVLLLFTFLLSMVNVFYLKKLKPADTLKAGE